MYNLNILICLLFLVKWFLDCPNPKSLENGKLLSVTEHTKWNQTAVYQCNEDYSFSSITDNKMYCDSNGKWNENLVKCIIGKINKT